ncbi:MAG: hypothetical protein Q8R91_07320 [Candidatus Omnitrophota bacterium]|nr:hypothetical protein [Candidatus Omnitrophota bacterium]
MKRRAAKKRAATRHQSTDLSRLLHLNWTKRTAGMIKRSRISSETLFGEYESHFDRFEPAR